MISSFPSRSPSPSIFLFMVIISDLHLMLLSTSPFEDTELGDPVYNSCPSINKYLQSAYTCRPREFYRHITCAGEKSELRCQKSQNIAILSAAYGWSSLVETNCSIKMSVHPGCPMICVMQSVHVECNGKRKCSVDVSDATFSNYRCHSTPKYLGVIYTCLPRIIVRKLEDPDATLPNPCKEFEEESGNHDGLPSPSENGIHLPPPISSSVATTTSSSSVTPLMARDRARLEHDKPESIENQNKYFLTSSTVWNHFLPTSTTGTPTNGIPFHINRSHKLSENLEEIPTIETSVSKTNQHPIYDSSLFFVNLSEMLWIWQFINDNTEKLVLYLSLSLSIGIIAILAAILLRMVLRSRFGRRCRKRPTSDGEPTLQGTIACSSPTWRAAESESSTGDDRTIHDDDVEMNSFGHIDSLQRRAAYHPHPYPSTTGRPGSSSLVVHGSNPTTATINRSYTQANPISVRCPSSPPTVPSTVNGIALSQSGRQSAAGQPASTGSLGRAHANRDGPEHYQIDEGSRTLQPLQHYYG